MILDPISYGRQFGWDGANSFCSSWYGAMFGICAENSVDNLGAILLIVLPCQHVGLECTQEIGRETRYWEREHSWDRWLTDPHLFSSSHWIVKGILNDNQLRHFLRQCILGWLMFFVLTKTVLQCWILTCFPCNFSSFRKNILLCRAST